ncbi:unannotated protein [freshwater metagenome]|uniref:Unannotated protein n=1 Tax=freshwater metagenome TaxID=449393 RepID=A0A6J6A4H6_9ZZZZ
MDADAITEPFMECRDCVFGERDFVGSDVVHAHAIKPFNRGTEPDNFRDRGSAGFELPWKIVGGEPVEANIANHFAATEERRHCFEEFLATVKNADAGWAAHLVAGEGNEVGPKFLNVGGAVRN